MIVLERVGRRVGGVFCMAAAAWAGGSAGAAEPPAAGFPGRTVQVIVPYPPGGLTDGLVRQLAAELGQSWKQSVVVENRGGGGTTIGTAPNVLYVRPGLPVRSVAELVAYAKARPGEVKFASTGNGSSPHLTAELLASRAGISILHVPYKGAGPALTDLLAGHVDAMFHFPASLALARQGKLRALAVAADERLADAPDLPTVVQAGVPGVVSGSWFGFFVPSATPEAIQDKIHRDVAQALRAPAVQRYMQESGLVSPPMSRAQFSAFIEHERDKWAEVIRTRNIRLE